MYFQWWEDLYPFGPSVYIAVATLLFAIILSKKLEALSPADRNLLTTTNPSNSDPYTITKCPNPNCARCSRYAELNRSAQRRVPHVAKGESLERLRRAISVGPAVEDDYDDDGEGDSSTISPIAGQRPNVLLVRGLESTPIVTTLHRDACRILEDFGKDIVLKEYRSAMESHSVSALENDVRTGTWQVLHLMNQGIWIQSNIELCPKTTDAVQSIQGTMNDCIFGNIFISALHPGTIVDPHCGPTNARHRLHFPLLVPSVSAGGSEPELRVAKERTTWTEGRCVVFDDSIVHSASYPRETMNIHEGGMDGQHELCRIVLIVDLWHPELSDDERKAISELYPAAA